QGAHGRGPGAGPLSAARRLRGALLALPRAPRQPRRLRDLRPHRPAGLRARAPRADRPRRDEQTASRGHREAEELQAGRVARGEIVGALTEKRAATLVAALFISLSARSANC